MPVASFPPFITALPEADVPLEGVRAWLVSAEGRQVVFFEIEPTAAVPAHSHEEQWGIVVEGEMDLTIGGVTRRYRAGDSYHIPAGVPHGATFRTRFRAIDVFATPSRYRPRAPGGT